MFKKLSGLISGRKPDEHAPTDQAGEFFRPMKPTNKRKGQDRRVANVPVALNRRKTDRRSRAAGEPARQAVPAVRAREETQAIAEPVQRTGTDDARVISIEAMRRASGTSDVAVHRPAHAKEPVLRTVETAVGAPLTGRRHHEPGVTPPPAARVLPSVAHSPLKIQTEHDLARAIGRRWRGFLLGVVHSDWTQECIVLDVLCGHVVIVMTERAAKSQHYTSIRKKIETDWNFHILATHVLSPELVQTIYRNILIDRENGKALLLDKSDSMVRVYDDIVRLAVEGKVSDIHFESFDGVGGIRIRVTGDLRYWIPISEKLMLNCLAAAFGQRYKTQSGTKPNWSQENPLSFMTSQPVNGSIWDGRYNGRPHACGYKAVMRLLDSTAKARDIPDFKALGYNRSHVAMLETALARQWGLVIIFGSTGEGKSTTIRSMVVKMLQDSLSELAVYTVESPVEYRIPLKVVQYNVPVDVTLSSEEISRKYTEVLRDAVRQDPDALVVSEVRDNESARIAIEFTVTGHRCFTTGHAEGAIDGLTRMTGQELRIPADTLGNENLINCVIYQKLLPRLCPHCKAPADHKEWGLSASKRKTLLEKFGLDARHMFVANPNGCPECQPSIIGLKANGTKGVVVAAEIFIPTLDMLPLIAAKKWSDVRRLWRERRTEDFAHEDMTGKTAYESALWLVDQGIVSLKNVEARFEPIEGYRVVNRVKQGGVV